MHASSPVISVVKFLSYNFDTNKLRSPVVQTLAQTFAHAHGPAYTSGGVNCAKSVENIMHVDIKKQNVTTPVTIQSAQCKRPVDRSNTHTDTLTHTDRSTLVLVQLYDTRAIKQSARE